MAAQQQQAQLLLQQQKAAAAAAAVQQRNAAIAAAMRNRGRPNTVTNKTSGGTVLRGPAAQSTPIMNRMMSSGYQGNNMSGMQYLQNVSEHLFFGLSKNKMLIIFFFIGHINGTT